MTITAEELAAFADGELAEPRASEVAAAIGADPELARQLAAHRALRQALTAHFNPIAAEPVPDRLRALLTGAAADADTAPPAAVIDLAAARASREARRKIPRWTWVVGPAIAATLGLLVFRPPGASGPDYAGTQLAAALDSRLSSDPVAPGEPRILASFARADGAMCRAYAGQRQSGIACRDSDGWRIERTGEGVRESGDYRQAGSPAQAIMAAAQEMASGPALDQAGEQAARARGWR